MQTRLRGPGPVVFTDGATASGLAVGTIDYYDSGGNPIAPLLPDADGFDSRVAKIKITFSNSFNASDGTNHPSFNLRFRVRVK
jgi:hypothetical protein